MKPRQLTFDLGRDAAYGRADFFEAPCNAAALKAILDWRNWPDARLALAGPAGSGKTHLAHIWAGDSDARLVRAENLDEATIPDLVSGPLALDMTETVTGDRAAERALFHLLNMQRETGQATLIPHARAPARWPVTLPDLASRLSALPLIEIGPPDDDLLAALFVKLFSDRQLHAGEGVIRYLVMRSERSFSAAMALVERLDAVALEEKQELRKPLVRRVLGDLAEPE